MGDSIGECGDCGHQSDELGTVCGKCHRGIITQARNTVRGVREDSFLHLKCTRADKTRWLKASNRERMKLVDWVKRALDERSQD